MLPADPGTAGRPRPRDALRLRRSVLVPVRGSRHLRRPGPVLGSRYLWRPRPRVPSPRGDPAPSAGPVTPKRPRLVRGSRHRRETSSSSAGGVTAGKTPFSSAGVCQAEEIRPPPPSVVPVTPRRHRPRPRVPSPQGDSVPGAGQAEEIRPRARVPSSLGVPVPCSRVPSPRGDPDPSTGLITPRRPVPHPRVPSPRRDPAPGSLSS